MLKPPHPVARLAYTLAMFVNPNNHALDGGRATSSMEKEAVAEIAAMFGWKEFLGHLCGGGTMANLEALWVAGQSHPRKKILASEQAHYTHKRISSVLQLEFEAIECDNRGRIELEALESRLKRGHVGTVVATLGTTATGSVDPLPEILALRERYEFRVHIDAAYGGYFVLASNLAIRTNMGCSRTVVDACCSATRLWADCTSTNRHTLTSVLQNCIWVRSALNVRGPALRRRHFGRRRNCYRLNEAVNLRRGSKPGARPHAISTST